MLLRDLLHFQAGPSDLEQVGAGVDRTESQQACTAALQAAIIQRTLRSMLPLVEGVPGWLLEGLRSSMSPPVKESDAAESAYLWAGEQGTDWVPVSSCSAAAMGS